MRKKLSVPVVFGTFIALMAVTFGVLLIFSGDTTVSSERLHSVEIDVREDMASPDDLASLVEDDLQTEEVTQSEPADQTEGQEPAPAQETVSSEASDNEEIQLEERAVFGDPEFEQLEFGSIPAIVDNPTDTKVLDAYSLTSPKIARNTQALYSLLVLDYGLSEKINTAVYENLPPFTTLIASPYSSNLPEKITEARDNNYEVWLNVPLENTTNTKSDNGPYTLRSKAALEENKERLYNIMASSPVIPGLYTNAQNKTNNSSDLRFLLTEGKERGYGLFLQGKSGAPEFYLSRNQSLPSRQDDLNTFIEQTLQQSKGVFIIEANPKAFEVIKQITQKMSGQGLQLVPLTRLVRSDI